MHITVRGWGRNLGKTNILDRSIIGAPESNEDGRFSPGAIYKTVLHPDDRRRTSVKISASAEMRLSGTYMLQVSLSRKEIAQLFYETHAGSLVRMVRAFIEDEAKAERAEHLAQLAETDERRKKQLASAEADDDEL